MRRQEADSRLPHAAVLLLGTLLLLARPSQATPDLLECSRDIAAGANIMGQVVQESASASLRLTATDGTPINCGEMLSPGEAQLGFDLSGESGEYLIEAVASAGTGAWGMGSQEESGDAPSCSGQRDVNRVSATYTVPASGTVTLRAVWASSNAGPVYVSPDCVYVVSNSTPPAACALSTYGCCADGTTAKSDASGTNCLTSLPVACADG